MADLSTLSNELDALPENDRPNLRKVGDGKFDMGNLKPDHTLSWGTRSTLRSAREIANTLGHKLLLDHFNIWLLGGKSLDQTFEPIYSELAFNDEGQPDSTQRHIDFWGKVASSIHDRSFNQAVNAFAGGQPRPIYIPFELSHPRCLFVGDMVRSAKRAKALLIAMYGTRNARCCSHCIKTFASNFNRSGTHVMTPFSECVSLSRDHFTGKCANCQYNGYGDCEWTNLDYRAGPDDLVPIDAPLAGKDYNPRAETHFTPEVLHHGNAPRIFANWPPNFMTTDRKMTSAEVKETAEELLGSNGSRDIIKRINSVWDEEGYLRD